MFRRKSKILWHARQFLPSGSVGLSAVISSSYGWSVARLLTAHVMVGRSDRLLIAHVMLIAHSVGRLAINSPFYGWLVGRAWWQWQVDDSSRLIRLSRQEPIILILLLLPRPHQLSEKKKYFLLTFDIHRLVLRIFLSSLLFLFFLLPKDDFF